MRTLIRDWWSPGRSWSTRRGDDNYRVERVLATGRAFVALVFLAALHLDPTELVRPLTVGYGLVLVYVVHSVGVLILLEMRRRAGETLSLTLHVLDLLWAGIAVLVAEVPGNSSFWVFFGFVLAAAAYRWGLRGALASASAAVAILVIEARWFTDLHRLAPSEGSGAIAQQLVMRMTYLLTVGGLLGYLAEQDRLLRVRSAVAADLMARVRSERGVSGALQLVAADILRLFVAREFRLVVAEVKTGRLFAAVASVEPGVCDPQYLPSELPSDQRPRYLFEAPPAWSATRRSLRDGLDVLTLDADGHRTRSGVELPQDFLAAVPFRTLLSVSFEFDGEWVGRLFLSDVPRGATREDALSLLQHVTQQVAPAVYGVYLFHRLRTRAGAIERARVARELHDGVIQSLVAVEMRLDVLARQQAASPPGGDPPGDELGRLQGIVHDEVLNLRDLMQQMKPMDLTPRQLLDYLADLVDRFRRDTGIAASFVSDLQDVPLPQAARREIARIAQEALVNVRKHSGARHVVVRLDLDDGACRLVVDDDGRGYDFEGRHDQTRLDAARRGPVVIKERVRAIGGDLTIESLPGSGSRLEVRVPGAARPEG